MRVLILNPPADVGYVKEGRCEQKLSSWQYVMVPISLPYIAAVVREYGFDVKIVDSVSEKISPGRSVEIIREYDPELIIMNTTTPTIGSDLEFGGELKKLKKSFRVAVFGVHVTSLPGETLRGSGIDFVIRGEPEITSAELAKAIDRKTPLKNVPGISYKKGSGVYHNKDRPFIKNLDRLPFPARDLLRNEVYTMPIHDEPYTLMVPSRGCPGQCVYCTANIYYGRVCRERSPGNIVDEIEEIVNEHKIMNIAMWSDTFTMRKGFVMGVCDEIIRRGVRVNWMCNSRVNTVDPEMLRKMRKAGCSIISYGVESGVQEILNNAKKGITLRQIENAIKWTNSAGIETIAHVIFGLPGETPETMRQTIKFIKKVKPTYAQFYCAIPFPGTEFYETARENGWLLTDRWEDFEIDNPIIKTESLSPDDVRNARMMAFRKFYFTPNYAFNFVKRIRSPSKIFRTFFQAMDFMSTWVFKKRKNS